jgi:uncharacterized protein (TIGR04255 family)
VAEQAPPVNEVVLAVGFEPEKLLVGPMLPQMLGRWFEDRSDIVAAPPYVMPSESPVGSTAWSKDLLSLQIQQVGADPRYWITSSDSVYVTQVQPDYVAVNWRRREGYRGDYVHYETLRSRFLATLGTIRENLAAAGREIIPTRAELTYINVISPNELWSELGETHKLFAFNFADQDSYELLAINFSKQFLREDGSFRGRVHVALQPGVDLAKGQPRLHLNITVRSSDLGRENGDDVVAFLDEGHELANKTFLRLVTPEALENWGLR